MNKIIQQMARAMDVTSAFLHSFDEESGQGTVVAEFYSEFATKSESSPDLGSTYDLNKEFPGLACIQKASPTVFHADDPTIPEKQREFIVRFDGKSILVIPMHMDGRVVAYAELWESRYKRPFLPHEIVLCKEIALHASLALENSRLLAEADTRFHELSALYQASKFITSSLDLTTVLHRIVAQLCQMLDATSGYICDYDSALKTSAVRAEYVSEAANERERGSDLGHTYYLPDDFPETIEFLETGDYEIEYVDNPTISASDLEHMQQYGAYSILTIPVRIGTKPIAYVELWESRRRRRFTEQELNLSKALAQQAGIALYHAQLFDAIQSKHSQLRALMDSNRDGILMTGNNGQILTANHAALDYLEIPGELDDWVGQQLTNAFLAIKKHNPQLATALQNQQSVAKIHDAHHSEGEIETASYYLHWQRLPVIDKGESIGSLIIFRDISEEKLVTQMRDDLTDTLVHDLRGPLTSISTALGLLKQYEKRGDIAQAQKIRVIDRAIASTGKLTELVSDILEVSSVESSEFAIKLLPFDLHLLVTQLLDRKTTLFQDNQVEMSNNVSPELPRVHIDPHFVERVLENLVGNALKFTPAGGSVRIDAARIMNKQPEIMISISDSGTGIAPEMHHQLFQKFSKGKEKASGSGLGLYFCKMVVEAHGGRIWLSHSSPKGTVICFTLPVVANNAMKAVTPKDHDRLIAAQAVSH